MRIWGTRKKTYNQTYTIKIVCDRCNKTVSGDMYDSHAILIQDEYVCDKWDGSGYVRGWGFEHLCGKCAKELRQILIDNNFVPKEINLDW